MRRSDPRCPGGGKRCFSSRAKAMRFARGSHHVSTQPGRQQAYLCKRCGLWHLTTVRP